MMIPRTGRLMLKPRMLPRRLHLDRTLKVWFLTIAVDTNSIVIPILIITGFSGRKPTIGEQEHMYTSHLHNRLFPSRGRTTTLQSLTVMAIH